MEMKKIILIIALFLANFLVLPNINKNVYAQGNPNSCNIAVTAVTTNGTSGSEHLVATISVTGITVDGTLRTSDHYDEFYFWIPEIGTGIAIPSEYIQNGQYTDGPLEIKNQWNINEAATLLFPNPNQTYTIQLVYNRGNNPHTTLCSGTVQYTPPNPSLSCSGNDLASSFLIIPPSIDRNTDSLFVINNAPAHLRGQTLYMTISQLGLLQRQAIPIDASGNGSLTININQLAPSLPNGNHKISITDEDNNLCLPMRDLVINGELVCKVIGDTCTPSGDNLPVCGGLVCTCAPSDPNNCSVSNPPLSTFEYSCDKSTTPASCIRCELLQGEIVECIPAPASAAAICKATCDADTTPGYLCTSTSTLQKGINTAIGCIPITQPESIAAFFIKWGVRIAGGIAVLIFLAAGLQFIISSGDPKKVQSARELFMAALTGLLMIIFCVFLLRLIGFNILQIFQP